jgi:hypothetical protein
MKNCSHNAVNGLPLSITQPKPTQGLLQIEKVLNVIHDRVTEGSFLTKELLASLPEIVEVIEPECSETKGLLQLCRSSSKELVENVVVPLFRGLRADSRMY